MDTECDVTGTSTSQKLKRTATVTNWIYQTMKISGRSHTNLQSMMNAKISQQTFQEQAYLSDTPTYLSMCEFQFIKIGLSSDPK